MPKKTFTVDDLQSWQEKGLLSTEQLQRILTDEDLEPPPRAPGKKKRINPVIVAYYFGGFLALISFTFFIAVMWEDFSYGARLGAAFGVMVVTGGLGVWLRFFRDYHIAGGLLLLIATAVFPMFVYTVAELGGFWPDGRVSFEQLSYAFLYLSLISLPVAVAMLYLTRFPLISLVVAGLVHFGASAIGGIFSADQAVVTSATCGVFVLLGIGLSLPRKKPYTFWIKLYGLIGLQIGFTVLFSNSQSTLFGLLFLVVYLILVILSLYFQEVIYLVFGVIGVYTYIIRLIFDYLEDTIYFPLVLGIVGISIVILAVLYQRYGSALFRRKSLPGSKSD
jgi:hypothetical protein